MIDLLGQKVDARLTMGALTTFNALTGKQVEDVYTLVQDLHAGTTTPTAESHMMISAFVWSCWQSAVTLAGQAPADYATFVNSLTPDDVFGAFVEIIKGEFERKGKSSDSTQKGSSN